MKRTRICGLLNIQYPIIQAPMTWITPAELAAAVSNAGGLGTIGPNAGYRTVTTDVAETGERLREQIKKTKALTTKPFAVNFEASAGPGFEEAERYSNACIKVALEEGVPIAILAGDSPEPYVRRLKDAGVTVLHHPISGTVKEAKRAEELGVDAVIAGGYEAGSYSGIYRTSTLVLVPQVVDALKVPVVAAGGISDARGFVAALALGAEGIYMGTAFIATYECLAHPNYKQAIIDANDVSTVTWTGIYGSMRALRNRLAERLLEMESKGASPAELSAVEGPTHRQAALDGDVVNSIVQFGAGAGMIKEVVGAQELVQSIVSEADKILSRLQ